VVAGGGADATVETDAATSVSVGLDVVASTAVIVGVLAEGDVSVGSGAGASVCDWLQATRARITRTRAVRVAFFMIQLLLWPDSIV
jgi:hypothetical protein